MKRKKYSSKRFEIRPYTLKDYKAWFHAYTTLLPAQSKYDRGPYPAKECTLQSYKKVVARHKKRADDNATFIWGIFDKKTNMLVGALDIHILYRGNLQKANLGYQVFNTHWRKGIARETLLKLIPNALIDLKLNRLEATIDLANKPSIKLCKSLGLRSEGIRKNYYFQNGKWEDQAIFIADRELFKLPDLKIK